MSLVGKLIGFVFRQVVGVVAGEEAAKIADKVSGPVVRAVENHFTDHSQTLTTALARANDRAWQALSIALAGDSFPDKIKVFFASGDDKGIREQVRLFLKDKYIGFEGTSADFRKQCLVELNAAKQAGLLTAENFSPQDVARQTAQFQRFADLKAMMDGAEQVMGWIADELASEFTNLAKLLRQRPHGGPPLLVVAFVYFFRREVETNGELAHGMFFDGLRQLSALQEKAFLVAVETHGAVLDMQAELQRLGGLPDEVRRLMQEVLHRVSQARMHEGEVKPQHSFSIHSEDERTAVKELLAWFRQLPVEQQQQVPALLNGLGKLQSGSQDLAVLKVLESLDPKWPKANPSKPKRKPGEIITNSLGMKFAWIPSGTFLMGSPASEESREPDKGADEFQHKVTLTRGFFMGIYPVTLDQFTTFVQKTGFKTQAEREGGAHVWAGKEWNLDPAANWRTPGFQQANDHPVTCLGW